MVAPPSSRLQDMLQAAVQSVQWTYSLFWQICPQQGILVWGDGYYNGAIKTRKTVQPIEVSAEEASLQRSQQLRDLYESLSAGETNQPTRRPSAALSPEDLTESEWFYLMCASFSFSPGVELPGKAYARRQHVWLAGANEVDSKTFSRAILAKSALIQTVVCIPLLDGVVEFGTTDKVQEDIGLIQHVKGFFTDHYNPPPPKPALSEHSTSNPAASSDHHFRFDSSPLPAISAPADAPAYADEDQEDEEEEEEDEEEQGYDSEAVTGHNHCFLTGGTKNAQADGPAGEPSELMQLEMSEDIRVGSSDDASNNLESDFHLIVSGNALDQQRRADSLRAVLTRRWTITMQERLNGGIQPSSSEGPPPMQEMTQEDSHYSQTVSTILQYQPMQWFESSPTSYVACSAQSAFSRSINRSDHHLNVPVEGTSQWLLKYILFTVPYLHNKYREENSPKLRDGDTASRFRKGGAAQEELSANHVLAERRRREKLNERFILLRSLVPFVTKMDKASILGDTIEYLKQLRKKIQDLEARNRQMEVEQRPRTVDPPQKTNSSKEQRSGVTTVDRVLRNVPGSDTRKLRIVEGTGGGAKAKMVETSPPPPPPPPPPLRPTTPLHSGDERSSVEVSIIESDALLELQCGYREGLLLDIMQLLRDLRIETTAVRSSLNSGVFVAELRAKVKDNGNGRKVSIAEVKREIHQIIPHD